MDLIDACSKRITDRIFDVVCDTRMTPGQSLTVLKKARLVLDEQIADLEETIERQTAPPR